MGYAEEHQKVYFMVGTIEWQYNDENYYKAEGKALRPSKLYTTLAAAEAAVLVKEREEFERWNLREFGEYCGNDYITNQSIYDELAEKYDFQQENEHEWFEAGEKLKAAVSGSRNGQVLIKMSDEDFKRLLKAVSVNFAEVIEIELERE